MYFKFSCSTSSRLSNRVSSEKPEEKNRSSHNVLTIILLAAWQAKYLGLIRDDMSGKMTADAFERSQCRKDMKMIGFNVKTFGEPSEKEQGE